MSKEEDNKAVVGRWFTHFWGKTCDLAIVDNSPRRTCSCNIRYTPRRAATTSRCS